MKGAGTGSPVVVRALVWECYLSGEHSILMEHLEYAKTEAVSKRQVLSNFNANEQ